jgi:hypothetical protein
MPRITQNTSNWVEFSDLYIHDGSYLRVSNITLGYNFAKVIRWKNLSQFRLYAAVQNLVTFTKYSGMDPEVGASSYDASGAYFGQGVDNGFYPRPRFIWWCKYYFLILIEKNMIMKRYRSIIIALIAIISFSSCKNF